MMVELGMPSETLMIASSGASRQSIRKTRRVTKRIHKNKKRIAKKRRAFPPGLKPGQRGMGETTSEEGGSKRRSRMISGEQVFPESEVIFCGDTRQSNSRGIQIGRASCRERV